MGGGGEETGRRRGEEMRGGGEETDSRRRGEEMGGGEEMGRRGGRSSWIHIRLFFTLRGGRHVSPSKEEGQLPQSDEYVPEKGALDEFEMEK